MWLQLESSLVWSFLGASCCIPFALMRGIEFKPPNSVAMCVNYNTPLTPTFPVTNFPVFNSLLYYLGRFPGLVHLGLRHAKQNVRDLICMFFSEDGPLCIYLRKSMTQHWLLKSNRQFFTEDRRIEDDGADEWGKRNLNNWGLSETSLSLRVYRPKEDELRQLCPLYDQKSYSLHSSC